MCTRKIHRDGNFTHSGIQVMSEKVKKPLNCVCNSKLFVYLSSVSGRFEKLEQRLNIKLSTNYFCALTKHNISHLLQ